MNPIKHIQTNQTNTNSNLNKNNQNIQNTCILFHTLSESIVVEQCGSFIQFSLCLWGDDNVLLSHIP